MLNTVNHVCYKKELFEKIKKGEKNSLFVGLKESKTPLTGSKKMKTKSKGSHPKKKVHIFGLCPKRGGRE